MPEYVDFDDLADLTWEDLERIQWQHLDSAGANFTGPSGITSGLPKDVARDFNSTVAEVSR